MDVQAALRIIVPALPAGVSAEEDDLERVIVFVRRDLYHLDADALNDRLHAWIARHVHKRLVGAAAFVSFRHGRPATLDDAELDHQESWRDLEPTFRLDPAGLDESDVAAFVAFVPAFLALIEGSGRPAGWRRIDEGNAE